MIAAYLLALFIHGNGLTSLASVARVQVRPDAPQRAETAVEKQRREQQEQQMLRRMFLRLLGEQAETDKKNRELDAAVDEINREIEKLRKENPKKYEHIKPIERPKSAP